MRTRCSALSSDCRTTFAVSDSTEFMVVNRIALPPGRRLREQMTLALDGIRCGDRDWCSPAEDTLEMPAWPAKKMVPSSPQLAPQLLPSGTLEIVAGGPPCGRHLLDLVVRPESDPRAVR